MRYLTQCLALTVVLSLGAVPLATAGTLRAGSSSLSSPLVRSGSDWVRVIPRDEEFAILMPVPAEALRMEGESIFRVGGETIRERRSYGAYANGVAFLIRSYKAGNPRRALADFLQTEGSAQRFERDVTVDGFNGKQYQSDNNNYHRISQYFLTRHRLYAIEAAAREASNPDIQRFFSSLRLGRGRDEAATHNAAAAEEHAASIGPTSAQASPSPQHSQNQDTVFRALEVTRRAVVIFKPEPPYTEAALRNGIRGRVILRAVLSSTGRVTNIQVVEGLRHSLTENAIIAARHLRFLPAEREGNPVSQYVQIVYNFNFY